MSIHDSIENLGEINTEATIQESIEQNCDDKIELVTNNDNNSDTIHSEDINQDSSEEQNSDSQEKITPEASKNLFLILKEAAQQQRNKIYKKNFMISRRRNDIMRSVTTLQKNYTKEGYNKNEVKKLISSQRGINNNTANHKLTTIRGKTVFNPHKNENLITNHSYGNHIRGNIELPNEIVENFSSSAIPTKNVPIKHIEIHPIIPEASNNILQPQYQAINLYTEKPKEINLPEIITSVLQDVCSKKINTIDDVIGKLRVTFEEKNIFTNSKKKNVVLLNFEDDTIRPVLEIEDNYMTLINEWYNNCNLILEIEKTNISIPEVITYQDISGVLFQDINWKYKDEYLNNYLPIVINNIISSRIAKDYEKKYFSKFQYGVNLANNNSANKIISNNKELNDLGIQLPDNIKSDENLDENKICKISDIYISSDIYKINSDKIQLNNSGINCDSTKRIDPEILVKKYILNDPNKNTSDITDISCYNSVYIKKYDETLKYAKKGTTTYCGPEYNIDYCANNTEYDALNPNFSDNCIELDNELDNKIKSNIDLITVLFNPKFLQTISITKPTKDMLHIINNHPEFGFIKLFNILTDNKDIVEFISREFNKIQFNDIDEINKKLLVASQYIEFSNKHVNTNNNVMTEENQVKKYIENNFTIDDDINHKMKASILYDKIINSKCVTIEKTKLSGFQTRLSRYLKDLGLQKKRYNDGYYYYGIQQKTGIGIFKHKVTDEEFKKLVSERDNLFTQITYKFSE